LRLAKVATVDQIEKQLADSHGAIRVHKDTASGVSPVTVVGSDSVHVARIVADPNHPGTYFLWLVADNLRLSASNAIQIAESIMLAPAI
jgi:aspartate-semialdehyde dehydrogenase